MMNQQKNNELQVRPTSLPMDIRRMREVLMEELKGRKVFCWSEEDWRFFCRKARTLGIQSVTYWDFEDGPRGGAYYGGEVNRSRLPMIVIPRGYRELLIPVVGGMDED